MGFAAVANLLDLYLLKMFRNLRNVLVDEEMWDVALLACFERDFPTSDDKLMKRNFPLTVIMYSFTGKIH